MSNCANCEERDSSNAAPFIGPVTREGCSGCGTNGDWTGLPPENWTPGCTPTWDESAQLIALGRPGGIKLNWNLPADSPECVAFTSVYRARSADFSNATLMITAGGSFFFDTQNVEEATEYWYWIQFKSTAGVDSPLHGPQSSVMMPTIDEIIKDLEGKISNSELNNHLNTEIGNIAVLGVELDQEILDRIEKDNSLNEMFDGLKGDLTVIDASITSLTDKVINDEKAYIEQIDLVLVQFNASLAAFQTQLVTLADADKALLDYVESFKVDFDGNEVGYEEALLLLAEQDKALGVRIDTLDASVENNTAEISRVETVSVEEDQALALRIDTLSVSIDGDPDADPPIPSQSAAIEVLAAVVGVDENTVVGDASASLTATYSIKTQVDGPDGPLISGIGLYNDGEESSFGIHADTFYIANPLDPSQSADAQDQVYPFIIADYTTPGTSNTEKIIALNAFTLIPDASLGTAMIQEASITDALIGNSITSDDYVVGESGWAIFKKYWNGKPRAEFYDIIARGTIFASHIETGTINIIDEPGFFKPGVVTNATINNINSDNYVSILDGTRPAAGWGIFKDFFGVYGDPRYNTGETDEDGNLGIPGQPGWPGGDGWTDNVTGEVYPEYHSNSTKSYFAPVDRWKQRWYTGTEAKPNGATGVGNEPVSFIECDNLIARGTIEASSLKVNTAMVETLNVKNEAIVAAAAVSGNDQANNGSIGSFSFNPLGGRVFATVSMTGTNTPDKRLYISLTVGGVTASSQIYANDGSSSGEAKITVPVSLSAVSAASNGNVTIQARISGNGVVSDVLFSASAYKR